MKSHYAEVNGIRLHYLKEGNGKLMLFLHGFPEYSGIWREQMAYFSSRFTCVAPDLRGFNLSSQPQEVSAYKPKELYADIKGLIGHLGFKTCVLVAHDWGGATAWGFAMKFPSFVEKLIILNAPHPVTFARELRENPKQREGSAYFTYLKDEKAEARLSANHYEKLLGFFNSSPLSEDRKEAYRTVWRRGLKASLNYYRVTPLQPDVPPPLLNPQDFIIKQPVLILWGLKDEALLPELLNGLDEVLENYSLFTFEDATHWLLHEKGREITLKINEFISK